MLARDLRDERSSYAALSVCQCDRLSGMSRDQLYGLKLWFVNRTLQDLVLPASYCVQCDQYELPPIDLDELL